MSRIAAIALAAAALSACAAPQVPGQISDALTPTEQWRAEVTSQPEEVLLAVRGDGMSPAQADALAQFLDDWREEGGGAITIQAPSTGVDSAAAFRSGESARAFLIDQGVPSDQVRIVGYRPEGEGRPPLRIGYLRHSVTVPTCGQEWTSLTRSASNNPQPNFGCAVTANMAAQIANPGDLVGPRAMTPPDAQRRAVVLDKYRKGQPTSSTKDEQSTGQVKQVAN